MSSQNNPTPVQNIYKSKADFVLQHHEFDVSVIVEKAKLLGIDISRQYVYTIRYLDKLRKHKKQPRTKLRKSTKHNSNPRFVLNEDVFRKVVLNIGLKMAKSLLTDIESKLK